MALKIFIHALPVNILLIHKMKVFVRFLSNMQEIDELGVDTDLNFTFSKQKNEQRHTII